MRNLSKKAKTIIAGAAIAGLASAGGAYAYWTTTGGGTGDASTTPGVVDQLSFTQNPAGIPDTSVDLAALFPGDTAQDLIVRVRNNSAESAYVTSVGAYITTDKPVADCSGADFWIGTSFAGTEATPTPLVWTPVDLAAGTAANATSSVHFHNTGLPQNGCKDAIVTLNYVAK